MSNEFQSSVENLAENFSHYNKEIKELSDKKKNLEEKLKAMLEERQIDNIILNDKKISFSASVRKTLPKTNEIIEFFHRALLKHPQTTSVAEEIMETVATEIENNKKETVVRILRITEK